MKSKVIITILIVAIVALLAVYYFLGMDYLSKSQRNEALTAGINESTQTLARTPKPPQDLEQRLAEAEATLGAVQSTFPIDLNSTRAINDILRLADDCQVRAIPLVTKPWSMENTGKGYHVFRLNVTVKGDFSQLVSFVSQLENGKLKTIVVENLNVTRLAGPNGDGTIPVIASLDLAIYSQFTTSE